MLSADTIRKRFRKSDLPAWARELDSVVWLCKRCIPFRCDVHDARSLSMRQMLIREADQQYHGV